MHRRRNGGGGPRPPQYFTLETLLIGASLSEPHTSVTAFAEVVCMYV